MKTYQIKILNDTEQKSVENILHELVQKGTIEFNELTVPQEENAKPHAATEDQVDEIIEESEIGPYYSEAEAKDILKL